MIDVIRMWGGPVMLSRRAAVPLSVAQHFRLQVIL